MPRKVGDQILYKGQLPGILGVIKAVIAEDIDTNSYQILLIGDTYTRQAFEYELTSLTPPKFKRGSRVLFQNSKSPTPPAPYPGTVVGIHDFRGTKEADTILYDVYIDVNSSIYDHTPEEQLTLFSEEDE